MKAFVASLVLLAIILCAIVVNALYSNKILERIEKLAGEVYKDSTSEEVLSRLCDYWSSHRDYLSLSVSLDDIDSVTECLLEFKAAAKEQNSMMLSQSYALLCNALDDIARFEKISIRCIL